MAFAFLVTFNCSTALAWYVAGQGHVYAIGQPPKDPENPITYFEDIPVGCYDAYVMDWADCPFSVSITEDTSPPYIAGAGHTHSRMVGTGIGKLSGAGAVQVSQWEVRGQTAQTFWIRHDQPEMSGGVIMKAVIPAPPGRVCRPDGSLAACTIIYHVEFQVQGLRPMPPSTANDYKFSGHPFLADGTPNNHTGNHFGTPGLIAATAAVAHDFFDQTGRQLSVNDMSLPQGGLYDYHDTGLPPHKGHRKGTGVDIDSVTVGADPKLQKRLTNLFIKYGCTKIKEATIHYECE